MVKVSDVADFAWFFISEASIWSGREIFENTVRAPHSYLRLNRILNEYHPKIRDYYNELFDIDLNKPKIVWGKDPSYNNEKDTINMRFLGSGTMSMLIDEKLPISSLENNLSSLAEEYGHRYHYHINTQLSNFGKGWGRFYILSEKESEESLVIKTFTEGVANTAEIKLMENLGFVKYSDYLKKCAKHFFGYQMEDDIFGVGLDPGFVVHHLLMYDDSYFKEFARKNHFEALSLVMPAWKDLDKKEVSGMIRFVF